MDFDESRMFYSHQSLQQGPTHDDEREAAPVDESAVDGNAVQRHFREILRNYRQGPHRYLYRNALLKMHRTSFQSQQQHLQVDLAHVGEYDAAMLAGLPPLAARRGSAVLRSRCRGCITDALVRLPERHCCRRTEPWPRSVENICNTLRPVKNGPDAAICFP